MANCPACASALPEGATTCPLCGFTLTASSGASRPAAPGLPTRPSAPRPSVPRPPGATGAAMTGASSMPGPAAAPAPTLSPTPSAAAPQGPTASATPRAPGADPLIGTTIVGKFEILDLLGEGGMGKVYKAKHLTLDRLVCIKMLRPALLEDATVVGRFEREAKAASRLNHGNSIQVLDFGQDEHGTMYIAMEFVSGKDLRKTLRDEFPLGEERICHIMAQVLSALAEAHAQNVIHRDLKPENIMLEQRRGEPDYVKVLDFGIAKIQDPDVPGLTRADVVCGTPLYMSPEQATGSKFDARADLYSIGVILYQLTTGTLPFDGNNSMEILTKHVTELPVPPRTRRPEVAISPEMELLILRALSKEAADRPQSAEEFRKELLGIGEKLKRKRQDAEEAVNAKNTAHKQERAQQLKDKQAAQLASLTGGGQGAVAAGPTDSIAAMMPAKSKTPLYAGIGVGVVVAVIAAVVALRPGPAPTPAPVPAPAPVTPTAAVNPTPPPVEPTPTAAPVPTPNPTVAANPTPTAAPTPNPTVAPTPAAERPTTTAAKDPIATVTATPTLKDPPPPPNTGLRPLPKGDTAKAKEIAEEADLEMEEGNFQKAISLYKQAAEADPSFAKAYRGLFNAGVAANDRKAIDFGGRGYLRAAPNAPDAAMVKRKLGE